MDRAIQIYPDVAAIAQQAAGIFVNAAQQAVRDRGVFRVAMAGGSTPKALHALLVAERAALDYEQTLKTQFALKPGELPRFDLMMLGMGNEGHTLSLFPGTTALRDNGRLVVRTWVGKLYTERITCTAPVANNSAAVLFMIAGADKAPALKAVLEGPYEPEQLPSQLIKPANGKLFFLVDSAAGGMLSKNLAAT